MAGTLWIYRINIIAPAEDKAALNALWTVVAPEGDSEVNTFGLPLSADGNDPPTHRGISTAATEEMRLLMVDTYADELAGCTISVQDYRENNWDAFLAANGLQVIEPEEL